MPISPLRKSRIRRIVRISNDILLVDNAYGEGNPVSKTLVQKRAKLMKKINFTSDQLARVNFMLRSES